MEQLGLTGCCGPNLTTAAYTFFSSVCGTFFQKDDASCHKRGPKKVYNIETIWNIFSDYSGMKLEINSERKARAFKNMWKLTQSVTTNGSKNKSQENSENIWRQMKTKTQHTKIYVI